MLQSLGLKMINEYKDDTVFYYMWYPTVVKKFVAFLVSASSKWDIFLFLVCVMSCILTPVSACGPEES